MTIKSLICSVLLAAFTCQAGNYDVPTNCPPQLPAPKIKQTKDPIGFTLFTFIVRFDWCVIMYCYGHGYTEYDTHTFALQRSNPNYNSGQWETLAYRDSPLREEYAKPLFSDRLDRDVPPNRGITTYRIVDLGSVTVPNP